MFEPPDDECTAAPGVMGHRACHKYPGCGCGQEKPERKLTRADVSRMRMRDALNMRDLDALFDELLEDTDDD